jgi:5-methylcytosine-specific restriction endonuclease McrA
MGHQADEHTVAAFACPVRAPSSPCPEPSGVVGGARPFSDAERAERHRIRQRAYRRTQKGRATLRRYQQTEHGKATMRAAAKLYRQSEHARVVRRAWRQEGGGREWQQVYMRRYRKTDRGKASAARYDAKRRGAIVSDKGLDALEWRSILRRYNFCCAYCGKPRTPERVLSRDHVIPVSKGGHHEARNVVPACLRCNSAKRDKSAEYPKPSNPMLRFPAFDKAVLEWLDQASEEPDLPLLLRLREVGEDGDCMVVRRLA